MMIKNFKPRLYQETILATAVEKNTLVVLPTGLGKTYIFLMLAAHQLKKYPDTKILLLGPTRPLISQYYNLFLRHFNIQKEEMAVFTGQVGPSKREEQWKNSRIIFSTPQGMENDVISNRVSMKEVSLLGFDEAHRAVGDYSYVWIAKQYMKESRNPRIIALTASPGSDLEKITEVCKNLYIEDVEIRTDEDPDVKPYIKEVDIKWNYVELPPEFKRIRTYLDNCFDSKISMLREYSPELVRLVETKRDILAIQSGLLKEISSGNNSIEIMKSLSLVAEAIKVQHALELLESQCITPLLENI
jgi:ERCC4-related helicase